MVPYRIATPDCTFTIIHPYWTSVRAWQDPTHVRALNEVSWLYYSSIWRKENKLDHYPIICDWQIINTDAAIAEEWGDKSEEERQFAIKHYFNVVTDLTVVLRAIK